jgi:aryl-alcohol dehydrogenase-like predicted oxidoreductase
MTPKPEHGLELGLGTIGLGRPWPAPDAAVPTEIAALEFLHEAVGAGIRFLDTAPAYGLAESRLGTYLSSLPPEVRTAVTVATKVGETWAPDTGSTVDHSLDACRRSVDRSLELLGRIDLLQVHKCTADVLDDPRLIDWLSSLRDDGVVGAIGTSVSDATALSATVAREFFDTVQFPANPDSPDLIEAFAGLSPSLTPVINRPFASGRQPGPEPLTWLRTRLTRGVVLSGTTSTIHLQQNLTWMKESA